MLGICHACLNSTFFSDPNWKKTLQWCKAIIHGLSHYGIRSTDLSQISYADNTSQCALIALSELQELMIYLYTCRFDMNTNQLQKASEVRRLKLMYDEHTEGFNCIIIYNIILH